MRWLRSFPAYIPPGRAYVVDQLERLVIADYDYTPLGSIDDDVLLIEWDMALDPLQAEMFATLAALQPHDLLVAPYELHHVEPEGSVYAHRRILDPRGERQRWLLYGEALADYVAFGLIYLPRALVREFLAAPAPARGTPPVAPGGYTDSRMTDQTFSVWHRHHRLDGEQLVRVEWSIRPVHLHARHV